MPKLKQFIPEWRDGAAPSYKPSTLATMESSIRAWLLPVLGETPIQRIDTRRVQQLLISMKGRKKKTIQNTVNDLFAILRAARRWKYTVPVVKWRDLYIPVAEPPAEGEFFTPHQLTSILAEFVGRKPWETFFTLLATTGLRASEILGLRTQDLDFQRGLIHIKQAAWEGQIQSVKTVSSRNSVPMTGIVAEKLKAHLVGHTHELVFVNRNGRPYSRNKIVEKILRPVLDKIGVERKGKRVGLHAFRHSLASMLIQSASPVVAQRQLRHKDASTTLGLYGHLIGNEHRNAVEQVQQLISW